MRSFPCSQAPARVWGLRLLWLGSLISVGLFGEAGARAEAPLPSANAAPSASTPSQAGNLAPPPTPRTAAVSASAAPLAGASATAGTTAVAGGAGTAPGAVATPPSAAATPELEGAAAPPAHEPAIHLPAPSNSVVLAPPAPSQPLATPSAVPSGSATPSTAHAPALVRLGDAPVFTLVAAHGNKSPEVRAREASDALQRAFNADKAAAVSRHTVGDAVVLQVGQTPILQLTIEDANAAGESSLDVFSAGIVAKVRDTLDAEGRRAAIAKSVFSISLLVFFGLIAFYLIGKLGEFAETAREFLDNRADRDLSIKVKNIEVVRPATLRSSAVMALSLGKWLGQAGIAYAWLVVALSLFDATRNYTQRLTGFVLGPVSQLMERLAGALPLLIVAGIAGLAVFVLVRFVGLFFVSVARGETPLPWLPADLAAPTSVLLRSAIVLAALVFAAPVVTGDANGVLGRSGAIILVALGLASTPLLASGIVGVTLLFGRRLRVGEFAEMGGLTARISAINLLEVRLMDAHRVETRVPHLLSLFRPLSVLGMRPRLGIEVPVSASAAPDKVREVLNAAGKKCGQDPRVDLLAFDVDAAHYRLSALCDSLEARRLLAEAALSELESAGIGLGRSRAVPR